MRSAQKNKIQESAKASFPMKGIQENKQVFSNDRLGWITPIMVKIPGIPPSHFQFFLLNVLANVYMNICILFSKYYMNEIY